MNEVDYSKKLRQFINPNHLGLCIFSQGDFFASSPYALAINYFLDWKKTSSENENENMMFLPTLYNRTFPIFLSQTKIEDTELSLKLKNLAALVPGLTAQQENSFSTIEAPKLVILFDQTYSKEQILKASKVVSKISFPLKAEHIKTNENLSFEFFLS